jgi:hypothetical protein
MLTLLARRLRWLNTGGLSIAPTWCGGRVAQREAALALGVRVAVHDSRQNDPNPIIWQADQDYRMADAIQAARTQPTRTRYGPERVGPER